VVGKGGRPSLYSAEKGERNGEVIYLGRELSKEGGEKPKKKGGARRGEKTKEKTLQ